MNEPAPGANPSTRTGPRAVFLSYASEDAPAAQSLCAALRAAGVEVWFDQEELHGGDAWDQKIRREIRTCALFIPFISRNTQARTEGYFRLEWHLADQRTHLMARSRPFLLPVCVDDTPESHAEVPESFAAVQWARLPSGQSSPAFVERVLHLLSAEERPAEPPLIGAAPSAPAGTRATATAYQIDDLIVDLGQWRVTRDGRDIPLPHLSFELLVALARSAPNLVTLDQLAERVWPGLTVTPETVSHRVKLVRDALGDDSRAPRYIVAVRGRGYRIVAAVQPLRSGREAEERHERSQAPAETASQPSDTQPIEASSAGVPVDTVATGTANSGKRVLSARSSRELLRKPTWLLLGVLLLSIIATLTWLGTQRTDLASSALANARFSRLAGFEGVGRAAAISRNGKFVAFLANREGRNDVWVSEVGSGTYRNLTRSEQRTLTPPREIRALGFSADSSLVSIWTRNADGSRPEDVNILAVPTRGGAVRVYLPEVAEYDWSRDGRKLVFHPAAPGDPIFVREPGSPDRRIYMAPAGVHCHFPVWSPDDAFIYFARGTPSAGAGDTGAWDIWRIRPSGTGLERLTTHNSYVAYPTLLDRRTMVYLATSGDGSGPWLYALDTERRIPHRISFGLETYTSLGANADGERMVATVVNPGSSLWRLKLRAKEGASAAAPSPALLSSDGAAPRVGPDYVLYVAWRGGRQGIWALTQDASREVWSSTRSLIIGAPAISPDGRHIAFITKDNDRTLLYVIDRDGSHPRIVADSLTLRGNPAWAPDGQSIVTAVVSDEEPHLMSIFLNGAPPLPLVAEYSLDPVWSPNGRFLVYSGADIGTTFPLRAAARDGRPYPLPALILTRGARRVAFSPDGQSLVVLRGDFDHKNFSLIDLQSGAERPLVELPEQFVIRDFDISPDGSEIVFDRVQENSELALIERAH